MQSYAVLSITSSTFFVMEIGSSFFSLVHVPGLKNKCIHEFM